MSDFIDPVYLVTVAVFVIGLERMGRPKTALSGIIWAGLAMMISIAVTFFTPGISNLPLILIGVALGSSAGWYAARRVKMVDMPQMVAIYNGMGAGAAAAIAAIELLRLSESTTGLAIALSGAMIGSVSIAGSVIAFLKLQGWMRQRPLVFPLQQPLNISVLAVSVISGIIYVLAPHSSLAIVLVGLFFALTLLYGFMMALPIGGADMPVIIALFNALTGIAVALDGFSIGNFAMVVAGILVGASGTFLTAAMARAMNRSLRNVLFGAFGAETSTVSAQGSMKEIGAEDAAIMLNYSEKVAIIPGFGMAAAQAQFAVKDLMMMLRSRGVNVFFAIHPVAGRMPGHMNVLLAEAGVPYELMLDDEASNREMESTDVALIIGANDVVNPAARTGGTALSGMPIIDADRARNAIVMKRGKGRGFSGIQNELFFRERTKMLYGDAKESVEKLVQEIKRV